MVRRTDTEEESADILGKFYQMSAGGIDAPLPLYSDVNDDDAQFGTQTEERLPEDDLVFASDSQEEDAMIRQALRASQYQDKLVEDVLHSSLVRPPSSTTTTPSVEQLIPGSSDSGLQKYSLDALDEREQLELAMKLSKAENDTEGSYKDASRGYDISSEKTTVRSFASVQHGAVSHTPMRPRTKVDVRKSTHTTVFDSKTKTDTSDDELQKALQQSSEEFENLKQRQEDRNTSDADRDLQKALELSRLEYGPSRSNAMNHTVKQQNGNGSPSVMDKVLERALELSKLEAESNKGDHCIGLMDVTFNTEVKQSREKEGTNFEESDLQKALELSRVEYEQCKTNTNAESQSEAKNILNSQEPGHNPLSSNENDLTKVLEISRRDCKQVQEHIGDSTLDKEEPNIPGRSAVHDIHGDSDVAKVLELTFARNKEQSNDSDLEKALELSRIEYSQSTNCTWDEKNEDTAVVPSRESVVPALNTTPFKESCLIDAANDDVVPSSVTSEWEPDHENHDTFSALDHVTPAGSSKYSAILLDSQEFDDEVLDAQGFQIEEVPKANKKQLFATEEDNSIDEDYAYALKVQEELNEHVKSFDSCVKESSTSTATVELEDQLTSYRESQKEKYGKGGKSSRGLDFRRNVAAIACGKPVQIGVASPISRPGHSQKKQDPRRVLGDMPSPTNRIDKHRNNLQNSPRKPGPHKGDVYVIRDDDAESKTVGTASRSALKSSDERCFVSPSSPRPSSSAPSAFERVHTRDPSFSGPSQPSYHHTPSITPSMSRDTSVISHVSSSSDKPMGPKCGACGGVGHNKNSKICPQYFSAEAVQRREEQSRKRKAKREEDEREFNDSLGALAAQRLAIEERSRTLGEQLDELRRQSQNMANTQKMVEDAIKRKRKR